MLSIAIALLAAPVADPMAPARDGLVACSDPDIYFKSCTVMTRYTSDGAGAYTFSSQMVLDDAENVLMHVPGRVVIRGAALCERYSPRLVDQVHITVDGDDATAEELRVVRGNLKDVLRPFIGKEMCTTVTTVEDSDILSSYVTIDGKRSSEMETHFMWVDPADGWSVTN